MTWMDDNAHTGDIFGFLGCLPVVAILFCFFAPIFILMLPLAVAGMVVGGVVLTILTGMYSYKAYQKVKLIIYAIRTGERPCKGQKAIPREYFSRIMKPLAFLTFMYGHIADQYYLPLMLFLMFVWFATYIGNELYRHYCI